MSENRNRRIVELRGLGYSQEEISKEFDISQSQVQYRLSNLKQRAEREGKDITLKDLGLYRGAKLGLRGKASRVLDEFGAEYTRNKRFGEGSFLVQPHFLVPPEEGSGTEKEIILYVACTSGSTPLNEVRAQALEVGFIKHFREAIEAVLLVRAPPWR